MITSCEMIKDLLPLYHDGVCSSDSKAAIEEHIASCDECKTELESMADVLPAQTTRRNLTEAEAVQKLAKRWKKGMWKSALKGVLFTILGITAILLIIYIFADFKVVF